MKSGLTETYHIIVRKTICLPLFLSILCEFRTAYNVYIHSNIDTVTYAVDACHVGSLLVYTVHSITNQIVIDMHTITYTMLPTTVCI